MCSAAVAVSLVPEGLPARTRPGRPGRSGLARWEDLPFDKQSGCAQSLDKKKQRAGWAARLELVGALVLVLELEGRRRTGYLTKMD